MAVQTCCLCSYLVIDFIVEHVQMKFNWDHPSIEENYGHTQSEWGRYVSRDKKKSSVICAYKMKWETP